MKPNSLPWGYFLSSGLRQGIPFVINQNWTTEQAVAVVELLDDLREAIWNHYELQLYDYIREYRVTEAPVDPNDEFDPFK